MWQSLHFSFIKDAIDADLGEVASQVAAECVGDPEDEAQSFDARMKALKHSVLHYVHILLADTDLAEQGSPLQQVSSIVEELLWMLDRIWRYARMRTQQRQRLLETLAAAQAKLETREVRAAFVTKSPEQEESVLSSGLVVRVCESDEEMRYGSRITQGVESTQRGGDVRRRLSMGVEVEEEVRGIDMHHHHNHHHHHHDHHQRLRRSIHNRLKPRNLVEELRREREGLHLLSSDARRQRSLSPEEQRHGWPLYNPHSRLSLAPSGPLSISGSASASPGTSLASSPVPVAEDPLTGIRSGLTRPASQFI